MDSSKRTLRFALLRTFDPGNVGASLRAVTNMCDGELWEIDPIKKDDEALLRFAAGSKRFMHKLVRGRSLHDFCSNCDIVYALSARVRSDMPHMTLNELTRVVDGSEYSRIGFLFGNETSGLTDEELQYAAATVIIPAPGLHTSLNLSQAVLLTAWAAADITPSAAAVPFAGAVEKEALFENIYSLITSLLFKKEITATKTRRLLFNAIKRWPLTRKEFKYINNTVKGMAARIKALKQQ